MAELTQPAQSTSARPAAQPANQTEQEKHDERVAKAAQDKANKQSEFVEKTVQSILDETADYGESDRDTLIREIAQRVRSVRVVAAAAQLRTARSHVLDLEDKHAPFLTPQARPGEVPSRNILAQTDHLAAEAKK